LAPERLIGAVIGLAEAPAALMAMDSPATTPGLTVVDLSR
jgi:alcohol dehydrogenase